MIKLLKSEIYKGIYQMKFRIFMLVMIVIPIVSALGIKLIQNTPDIKNNPDLLSQFTYSSFEYPLFIIGSISDLLFPVMIVILLVSSITEEYVKGTLKISITSPVSREKVLSAKLIAIIVQITILLIVFLLFSYATGFIFFENTSIIEYGEKSMSRTEAFGLTVISYLVTMLALIALTLVYMVFALVLDSSSIVIGISVGLLLFMQLVTILGKNFAKFTLGTYLKFYNVFFVDNNTGDIITGISILMLYAIVCYLLSLFILKKKDLIY